MHLKNVLLPAFLLASYVPSNAQTFVPPNIDFEAGTTANWTFYRGSVVTGHVFTLGTSAPVTGLHTLTSGSGTDTYGGFPVVGSGSYSLMLAHDTANMNADAASYTIHVPTGGAYSLSYKYAAVLEGSSHAPSMLAVMKVVATDSATGATLPDSLMVYPTSAGFSLSSTGTDVYYKPWTSASLDMSGYGGHTIIVNFIGSACGEGGHFGYGYIDVTNVSLRPGSLGLSAQQSNAAFHIYPNPASGKLRVNWTNQQPGKAEMQIADVAGRVVSTTTLNMNAASGETEIDVTRLEEGIYTVSLKTAGISYSDKLVIQK